MVDLGDFVKDTVSGFKGVAISKHIYLQGCNRITVQPPIKKNGELPKVESFDEPQLVVLKPKREIKRGRRPGGPAKYNDTPRPIA